MTKTAKHAFTAVPTHRDDKEGFAETSKHASNAKSSGPVTEMDGSLTVGCVCVRLIQLVCIFIFYLLLPFCFFVGFIQLATSIIWPPGNFCISITKIDGRGRDWILNSDGTIAAKHQADLVLGLGHHLVDRGSERQLVLNEETISALKSGDYVTFTTASGQGIGKNKETQEPYATLEDYTWQVIEAEDKASAESTILVRYQNDNFIMDVNDNMALDVSNGMHEAGNTDNFVEADDDVAASTEMAGGGRDWVINVEDGTISPKSATHLALGRGASALILVEKGHSRQIVMENMEGLMNGETISASLSSPGNGDLVLSKKYEEYKEYQEWHYIEGIAQNAKERAIHIRYEDGNYLRLVNSDTGKDENLVFDVSFWNMVEGNTVNYVGGECNYSRGLFSYIDWYF